MRDIAGILPSKYVSDCRLRLSLTWYWVMIPMESSSLVDFGLSFSLDQRLQLVWEPISEDATFSAFSYFASRSPSCVGSFD